ncbi:5-formyltetrahydrofolate cyclo-ligase [Vibrio fluvialis]|jgi:5-formyltetrahydrofolate cyclo-ligase|uniref:5-formyltetrahydrofolate cyclo-ligase n=1 Tax=Vibrio fluvialis TaxID=676 RepID=UPI000410F0A0|nr:5-formyltetrahydrofolate cyclo-ligase [Vibrio fluvialis]TNF11107.1 MAG: 5-formyltetrahydrofolate cyclo-ligase [Vibrionaceae bacterium]EKO3391714.1 5-formyltetrahydrofolate cyclo-ligase [Vibrio fluvialis]EKO3400328.1 5-formyltetrahydrofolate cyclo-ligase [Vibrio fluvialis]EKO3514250.1 5-formyltetrahydrofolate cyclo-ligase [Vibrio fluvialis]EKO3974748.1 5-formyltetrahydrofolate cyclo-ligase [Vibrio fluvialis]
MQYSRHELRKLVRQQRNQLSSDIQYQASQDLICRFAALPEMQTCHHIALYLSTDGELDTQPLIEWLWSQGKAVYLPVLHPFSAGHLLFLHYQSSTPMTYNKFGILEPKLDQTLVKPVKELDLICTPLVAFDSHGHRLGMGGGYYDRTLAHWFKTGEGAQPMGLAHDCQHVEQLPTEAWDIPLPKIITPSQIWQWKA